MRALLALALFAASTLDGGRAVAEQWGGIEPGVSTMASVKSLRGSPSRTTTRKVDGYDTQEWIFEEARAPAGIRRMSVEFGLMTPAGYRADLVRSFKLEPKLGAFDKASVMVGWGAPAGVGKDGDAEFFFYKEGLFVYFAPDGHSVISLTFTPPQLPPAGLSPPR